MPNLPEKLKHLLALEEIPKSHNVYGNHVQANLEKQIKVALKPLIEVALVAKELSEYDRDKDFQKLILKLKDLDAALGGE